MGIQSNLLKEAMKVYRYKEDIMPDAVGGYAPINTGNADVELIGSVNCMINTGDSLEPDVRGAIKQYVPDVSTMWLCWMDIPVGFEIYDGDLMVNGDDGTRKFVVQFLDRRPGGIEGHHYECRLLTTEALSQN